ncbi:MerR family DNA-binding protein [Kribbella sp. NPDC055071]
MLLGSDLDGPRVYSDGDLWMLGFLRCLRDTGMSIEQLRRYGELSRDETTMPARVALLEEHAASIRARIDELEASLARVDEKTDWYRGELRRTDSPGSSQPAGPLQGAGRVRRPGRAEGDATA